MMRLRLPLVAVPAGVAGVLLFSAASLAENPTIEGAGGEANPYWSPASAEIAAGGSVTFKNPSTSIYHGVAWTGGPETPKCTGVPVDDFKYNWSGSCTFTQAGAYPFKCTVHPTMTGKITVTSSGTTPGPSPQPGPPGAQPGGPALQALNIAKAQRGNSVRGSLNVSSTGAGSRLRVDLFATRAMLFGSGHPGKMRVGLLTRSSLSQGHVGFRVSLKAVARRALRQVGRLPLQVKVTLTPPLGEVQRRTRKVTLHV
jgi:plastocyanin